MVNHRLSRSDKFRESKLLIVHNAKVFAFKKTYLRLFILIIELIFLSL